jgi:hypothetical protein
VEEQLLPSEKLKPIHDKIVWLYVYNDFKEGEADRAATRIRIRFSVSSWPQLLLVDPYTLEVVGQTGRQVDGFIKAVENVKIERPKYAKNDELLKQLKEGEELAAQLETKPSAKLAKKALEGQDLVARFRAVEYLGKEDPGALVENAAELLKVKNDLLRYEVCKAIKSAGEKVTFTDEVVTQLEDIVREPKDSRNPNVLRSHAISALAICGDAGSLEAIKPHAVEGAANNGTTGAAVDAIGAIGKRSDEAKAPAAQILMECFIPHSDKPEDPKRTEWYAKMAIRIAQKAHAHLQDLTGEKVDFPKEYTEETRQALKKAFAEPVKKLADKAEKAKTKKR